MRKFRIVGSFYEPIPPLRRSVASRSTTGAFADRAIERLITSIVSHVGASPPSAFGAPGYGARDKVERQAVHVSHRYTLVASHGYQCVR